jgi:hypothetical protein
LIKKTTRGTPACFGPAAACPKDEGSHVQRAGRNAKSLVQYEQSRPTAIAGSRNDARSEPAMGPTEQANPNVFAKKNNPNEPFSQKL